MAVSINKKDDKDKLKKRVAKQRKKVAKPKQAEAGRPSTVDESETIMNTLVASGELIPHAEAVDLETMQRRESVWRLHLKGVNKTVISKFFDVSETTIYKDIKKYNEMVQDQMSSMGPAGVIVESYSWYEQLRGEAMRLMDLVDEALTEKEKSGGEKASFDEVMHSIRDKLPLMRLAKEIEDSKMRMLMGIGLVPKTKERNPVPALDADHLESAEEAYTTDQAKEVLDDIISKIQGGE